MKVLPATILTIFFSCSIASARLQSLRNLRTYVNVDSPGGTCTRNIDCQTTPRSRSPGPNTDIIGPDVCDCYGTSSLNPFDECQGESDRSCSIARCAYDMCQGYEAYCQRASNGVGTCALRPTNVDKPGGTCTKDIDCQTTLRSRSPGPNIDIIGPDVCNCYGTSSQLPFDECQGESDQSCSIAGCAYDTCEGQEAYCQHLSDGSGECALRPVQTNVDKPGGTCSKDSDCQATLRTQTPVYTNPVGPPMCDCYGSSSQLPFDECEGEQNCPIAGCASDTCEGQEAHCQRLSNGSGECALRPVQTNVDKPGGTCSNDSDCHTTIRSMVPSDQDPTGPNLCDCYASSSQLPFDECEGQTVCAAARCSYNMCQGQEAYCQIVDNDGTTECVLAVIHHAKALNEALTVM